MKDQFGIEKTIQQLEKKEAYLLKVKGSKLPTNKAWFDAHYRRVNIAGEFVNELQQVIEIMKGIQNGDTSIGVKEDIKSINVVTKSTFNRLVAKFTFATMEFDGQYCKVCVIERSPKVNSVLIWTASQKVFQKK